MINFACPRIRWERGRWCPLWRTSRGTVPGRRPGGPLAGCCWESCSQTHWDLSGISKWCKSWKTTYVSSHQKAIEMLVQERLEIELLWIDVVKLPQSSYDGATLVAPRSKVPIQQWVVYGGLYLIHDWNIIQKLQVLSQFGHLQGGTFGLIVGWVDFWYDVLPPCQLCWSANFPGAQAEGRIADSKINATQRSKYIDGLLCIYFAARTLSTALMATSRGSSNALKNGRAANTHKRTEFIFSLVITSILAHHVLKDKISQSFVISSTRYLCTLEKLEVLSNMKYL